MTWKWFTDDFKAANPDVLDSVRAQILGTHPLGYVGCVATDETDDRTMRRDHA